MVRAIHLNDQILLLQYIDQDVRFQFLNCIIVFHYPRFGTLYNCSSLGGVLKLGRDEGPVRLFVLTSVSISSVSMVLNPENGSANKIGTPSPIPKSSSSSGMVASYCTMSNVGSNVGVLSSKVGCCL